MRPLAISLSPNTESDDVRAACARLVTPWTWYSTKPVHALENAFTEYFDGELHCTAINSGRSALYVVLKALGIREKDEVLVQAFTCVAVPNAVHWTGAKPIFVDIDTSLNISVKDIKKKITKKTKALVVQHTFGIPADIEEIRKLCDEKKILLIEDCAHALGASYKGKKLGTYGEAAFFSFGRDKVISSVFGGMIATKDHDLDQKIQKEVSKLSHNNAFWVVQQLMHPVLFNLLILPFYSFGLGKLSLGKVLLFLFQKIGLLSKPVYKEELETQRPADFPKKLSGALASLALTQFKKLDQYNARRKEIAKAYMTRLTLGKNTTVSSNDGALWLRYPVLINKPIEVFNKAKSKGVLLGQWYSNVVDPKCNLEKVGYIDKSCPYAEKAAAMILNLPTYPLMTDKEVDTVIRTLQSNG